MSIKTYFTQVKNAFKLLPQPDEYTCQSASIAMATGGNIRDIREDLTSYGQAGDPYNMGRHLKKALGDRYSFNDNASLDDAKKALELGAYCIIHGWFTNSGHVIGLDGLSIDTEKLSYKFNVKDPWSEFDFKTWLYPSNVQGYDGCYSSYGIYAACIRSQSRSDAAQIYRKGELNSQLKGAWLHTITKD